MRDTRHERKVSQRDLYDTLGGCKAARRLQGGFSVEAPKPRFGALVWAIRFGFSAVTLIFLQFPNAVVLNAVGRRNTQMRAKGRKCAQKSANALPSPQKSLRALRAQRLKNSISIEIFNPA